MKNLLIFVLTCIIVCDYVVIHNRNNDIDTLKSEIFHKDSIYNKHFDNVEKVLDRIYEDNNNYYLDVLTEHTEYDDYILSYYDVYGYSALVNTRIKRDNY